MFNSENVKVVTLTIGSDPGASDEIFYMVKAPRALTVLSAYMVSEQTQNAGTAVAIQLENWGTAGTAIKTSGGTVVTVLGGTATAARLTARVPGTVAATAANDEIAAGEWLVARYIEEGAGWIANDRFHYQIHYVHGVGA